MLTRAFRRQISAVSHRRQQFFEAVDCLRSDDVLVMDRGFPCRWLVSALTARHIPFCIRCDLSRGFKVVREFLQSSRSEQVVVLRAPNAREIGDAPRFSDASHRSLTT